MQQGDRIVYLSRKSVHGEIIGLERDGKLKTLSDHGEILIVHPQEVELESRIDLWLFQ